MKPKHRKRASNSHQSGSTSKTRKGSTATSSGCKKSVWVEQVTKELGHCAYCGQLESDAICQATDGSVEWKGELEMLTNPDLVIPCEEDADVLETRPQHRVTEFQVYAECKHLVAIDLGLIEDGKNIYLSGWVKPVFSDDDTIDGGIPSVGIGPVTEWWFSGFDGSNRVLIGLETAYGSYILVKSMSQYTQILHKMVDKLYLSKLAIEELQKSPDAQYEELLELIRERSSGHFDEESLLKHSNFIVQQIISYDEAADDDEIKLLEAPAIGDFMKLCGITDVSEVQT